MLLKIVTLIGVVIAIWGAVRRATGAVAAAETVLRRADASGRVQAGSRDGAVQDMVRCDACGAWIAPDQPCICRTPPTP